MSEKYSRNKGHKNTDSLEVCSSGPDLYYSLRHPQAIQKVPQPVATDVCLKAHVRKQLREGSHFFARKNIQPFVKVGKMLFMAIALPPYLVLFFVPKLLVVELLRLLCFCGSLFYRPIKKMISQITAYGRAIKEKRAERKNRRTSLVKRLKACISRLKEIFGTVKRGVFSPFQMMRKAGNQIANRVIGCMNRAKCAVKKVVFTVVDQIKSFCLRQFKRLADLLDNHFVRPCQRLILPRLQLVYQSYIKCKKMLVEPISHLKKQVIYYLKNPKLVIACIQKLSKKLFVGVQKNGHRLALVFINAWKKLKPCLQFIKRLNFASTLLPKNRQIKFKLLSQRVITMLKVPDWHKTRPIFDGSLRHLKKMTSVNLNSSLPMQKMIRALSFQRLSVAPYIKEKRGVISQLFAHAEQNIKSLMVLKDRLMTAPIQKKMVKAALLAHHFNHLSRLTFAWISVLASYGMQLVRETSERLAPKRS